MFDVVIGNPPYNKGIDKNFIDIGYKLSDNLVCMIIPAKWQTAPDDYIGKTNLISYKTFRERYIKHISKVIFYPVCGEIFHILQVDGITIIQLDKQEHKVTTVENKSRLIEEFNNTVERNIWNKQSLNNIGNELVEYLGNYKRFTFPTVSMQDKYRVWAVNKPPGGGYCTLTKRAKRYFIGECTIEEQTEQEEKQENCEIEHTGAYTCIFTSDNKQECINFLSWFNCKLNQFLFMINISKLSNTLTDDCFRFVPALEQGENTGKELKYDHVYTDQEIYEKFNIPEKYITIIESLIKERKFET